MTPFCYSVLSKLDCVNSHCIPTKHTSEVAEQKERSPLMFLMAGKAQKGRCGLFDNLDTNCLGLYGLIPALGIVSRNGPAARGATVTQVLCDPCNQPQSVIWLQHFGFTGVSELI